MLGKSSDSISKIIKNQLNIQNSAQTKLKICRKNNKRNRRERTPTLRTKRRRIQELWNGEHLLFSIQVRYAAKRDILDKQKQTIPINEYVRNDKSRDISITPLLIPSSITKLHKFVKTSNAKLQNSPNKRSSDYLT